jgi:uncharacterized protein
MDLNFGINGSISVQAARPVTISSSTPIGMVVTADKGDTGLMMFNSADEGLTYVSTQGISAGTLEAALTGISLQGVNAPIVAYVSTLDSDDATNKTNVLAGLDALKTSDAAVGINLRCGIIIAPEYSADVDVATKIDSVAGVLWATGITDDFSTDETGTTTFAANFGSKNLLLGTGKYNANGMLISYSALMAGLIAYYDASGTYGWAQSDSNRVVKGVSGSGSRIIEYIDGTDCEARRLRQKGVGMIVKDTGWRSYGFETTDIDPIWQSLDRVRTFYKLLAAIMDASKFARDREADQLIWVKKSVVDFMNSLKGNNVVIGFDAYFDPAKNTASTVSAGQFYLTIVVQDMPSIRELDIELVYSDDWSSALINYLNS